MHHIQLTTGLIIAFDINESPMNTKYTEMVIHTGFIVSYDNAFTTKRTIRNMKIDWKAIIADWHEDL